jgi:hypothetical protein
MRCPSQSQITDKIQWCIFSLWFKHYDGMGDVSWYPKVVLIVDASGSTPLFGHTWASYPIPRMAHCGIFQWAGMNI